MNEEKLKKAIISTKKAIVKIVNDKDNEKNKYLFTRLKSLSKEICLVIADFKCEKCKTEENLTFHHLIMRKVKEYTNIWRYISQRYYWANSIILCKECHANYHGIFGEDAGENLGIYSNDKINKIKKKYEIY
jgi:5-methylcytosine-specific restriction endonuclease McrA